jgi:hypothetical protein
MVGHGRRSRQVLLCVLGIVCAGCAAAAPRVDAPAAYGHRSATPQVMVYWSCSAPETGVLRVEGLVESPWVGEVRFVEFELVGVDASDRMTTAASAALPDIMLRTNQQSPFRLDLRTTGREARVDLFYQYRFVEPEFDAALAPTALPRLAQMVQRFGVRDACAPDRHRSR